MCKGANENLANIETSNDSSSICPLTSADFFQQIDVRSTASLDYIINIVHSTLCSDSSAGKFEIGFVARFFGN